MSGEEQYFNIKAIILGVVFGFIALAIILGSARWYTVRGREGAGIPPVPAIPLSRRTPWRTSRRQDTARSEALPAYGDTQNTTIVAPGDALYRADRASPKHARTAQAPHSQRPSGWACTWVTRGAEDSGDTESNWVADECRRGESGFTALVLGRECRASANKNVHYLYPRAPGGSGGSKKAARPMESIVSAGGAELDESQSAKVQELRRRVVELVAVDEPAAGELPPQYAPDSTDAPAATAPLPQQ
ncbi:hypothetical protein NMY22_g17532 [Coprinellus aureogranulatus]|nr:hypothetical protein NMY22_g17532 [Coprinellus aureogranulatus]